MEASFAKILCPVDFDDNSLAALEFGADLARRNSGHLVVLHVVRTEFLPTRKADLDFVLVQEKGARHWLNEIARERLGAVPYELVSRSGRPDAVILHAAQEFDVDSIVLATHTRTTVPHAFHGSVAESVIRQSRWPVVLVPAAMGGNVDLVGAWMTPDPQTTNPKSTLAEVSDRMSRGGFHCMPVMEHKRLVGIITDHDIRSRGGRRSSVEVESAMSDEVITVGVDTSVQEAARLLIECKVGGLPVLRDEQLVGVITTEDILRFLLRQA